MPRIALPLLVVALTFAGDRAATQTRGGLPTWPVARAPAELADSIRHGDLVIISLQSAVVTELTRELERGGPAAAMKSCHLDANTVASRAAREKGIAVGRTADRLRNPANAPRPWAAPIVSRHTGRPASDTDAYVVDLGDRIGLLRPIAHRPMCTPCHGPAGKLDPQVRQALRERYPGDRAVDFREGDLRGWFWVEVPKR